MNEGNPDTASVTPSEDWINGLCTSWDAERSTLLGSLIKEDRLVASNTKRLRALSALKSKTEEILISERDRLIDDWLRACKDSDSEIKQFAVSVFTKHADPVYFFMFEEWNLFQSTPTSWQSILKFYQSTDEAWRATLRGVAVKHRRLDWVTAMTSEFNKGMTLELDDKRLKALLSAEAEAALKILLEHGRWREAVKVTQTNEAVIDHDGWKRLIEHCTSVGEAAVWHLAALCPPMFSHACFKILEEREWKREEQSDSECLKRLVTLASQCQPVLQRLAPMSETPKGRRSNTKSSMYENHGFEFEICFADSTLKLKKELGSNPMRPSCQSKYASLFWQTIGQSHSNTIGSYYFAAGLDCYSVTAEILCFTPPHAIVPDQLRILEEDRILLKEASDKSWARFVLEAVYWAQRQQRVAANAPPADTVGSYVLLNSEAGKTDTTSIEIGNSSESSVNAASQEVTEEC